MNERTNNQQNLSVFHIHIPVTCLLSYVYVIDKSTLCLSCDTSTVGSRPLLLLNVHIVCFYFVFNGFFFSDCILTRELLNGIICQHFHIPGEGYYLFASVLVIEKLMLKQPHILFCLRINFDSVMEKVNPIGQMSEY